MARVMMAWIVGVYVAGRDSYVGVVFGGDTGDAMLIVLVVHNFLLAGLCCWDYYYYLLSLMLFLM